MSIVEIALYLPFVNAVLYGLYYSLLQESYGVLSLSTIMFVNGVVYIVLSLSAAQMQSFELTFHALKDSRVLTIFLFQVLVAVVLQVTHYVSLKYTSATYMAFAELGYPLFVPLFTYFLFSRQELTRSIGLGGLFILLGAIIIARGGVQSGIQN